MKNDTSFVVRLPQEQLEWFNETLERKSLNRAELLRNWIGQFIEDNKEEKGITFTRVKKHDHIVGDEYTEEAVVKDGMELHAYYGILFGEMPSEVHDEQKEDIEAILNLKNGDYSLDHGDFWLNVEIEDA